MIARSRPGMFNFLEARAEFPAIEGPKSRDSVSTLSLTSGVLSTHQKEKKLTPRVHDQVGPCENARESGE